MNVDFRSAAPAVPMRPGRWPDGTRLSLDTPPATAVAVVAASESDRRRADELCVVHVYEVCASMTCIACVDPAEETTYTFFLSQALSGWC